jgi:predicted lipid-binding transport protein (Tim44 family)
MRDFGWGHRVAHVLGGIIEALIILLAVAVIAGLIFLLVRYLLVATRAAQLYVDQHAPPRGDSRLGGGPLPTDPGAPASPTNASTTPVEPTAGFDLSATAEPTVDSAPPTAPTVPADAAPAGGATEKLSPTRAKSTPKTATTKPVTKPFPNPRTPKTPPTE